MEKANYQTQIKKSYWSGVKDTAKTIAGIGIMATVGYLGMKNLSNEPTTADYQNANWEESSATAWDAYMQEKIPHNQFVWKGFQDQVKEKKSLEGKTMYPDLDNDGKVAK